VAAVSALPVHHREPFDRMLITQTIVEGFVLVTADPVIRHYGAPLLWVGE
jgi:PIN domain nuclease of toxin-antitoxin system